MYTCLCGNAVESEGATCERCAALQILGLDSDAGPGEIENTYRVLVKVWHPDRFQNDPKLKGAAEEKLKSINAAHAYLASLPEPPARRRTPKKSPAVDRARRPSGQPRGRVFLDPAFVFGVVFRSTVALIGLAISVALVLGMDRWLSSNSTTASFYAQYRSQLLFTLQTDLTRFKQRLPQALPGSALTTSVNQVQPSPGPATTAESQPSIAAPTPHVPMPYVTVGLTKDEVITVMGYPSTSSANALVYPNAAFYFHNNAVVGWKVSPALIPLHVKLWPTGHPDPRVTTFSIGSSKNDVIAVQGTPTMLSENKIAYNGSEVFFDHDRVIGWNDNHASERLRVAAR